MLFTSLQDSSDVVRVAGVRVNFGEGSSGAPPASSLQRRKIGRIFQGLPPPF